MGGGGGGWGVGGEGSLELLHIKSKTWRAHWKIANWPVFHKSNNFQLRIALK